MGAGEFPGGSLVPQQHSGRRTLSLPRHRHWTPGEQGELRLVPGLRRKLLTDFNCSLFLSESRCSVKFAVKSSYLQCKYLLQTDWRLGTHPSPPGAAVRRLTRRSGTSRTLQYFARQDRTTVHQQNTRTQQNIVELVFSSLQ